MKDCYYYKNLSDSINKAISLNQCLTIVSVYKTGISSNLLKIIDNDYKFPKFLFLWVDLNNKDIDIENNLVDEINFRIKNEEKLLKGSGFVGVIEGLKDIIKENNNIKIVLLIKNSHNLSVYKENIKLQLRKLFSIFNYSLLCIFLNQNELEDVEILKKELEDLYPYYTTQIYHHALFEAKDMHLCYQKAVKEMGITTDLDQEDKILRLSGGHIGLMRAILRHLQKNNIFVIDEELLKTEEIVFIFSKIWGGFTESTQQSILDNSNFVNKYLTEIKLKDENGKWFSPLLEMFVKNIKNNNAKPNVYLSELLSYQELQLYELFEQNKGKVVSKELIAKVLWSEHWVDKYSDWAIAQVVSQIRKKISIKGINIKAVKGEGYILVRI